MAGGGAGAIGTAPHTSLGVLRMSPRDLPARVRHRQAVRAQPVEPVTEGRTSMAAVRQRQGRGRLAEVERVRSFAALGGPVPGAAVAGAVMGWMVSLTPSLLPRSWLVQGIVSGVTAALGYAIGTLASVLLRPLRLRPPQNARSRRWRRLAWRAGAGAALGSLLLSVRWQQQLALTMGVDGPAGPWLLGVPAVTAALVFLAVVSARAAAALACAVAARAERRAPLGLAALGAAIVIASGLVAAQNLLTRGLLGLTDRTTTGRRS